MREQGKHKVKKKRQPVKRFQFEVFCGLLFIVCMLYLFFGATAEEGGTAEDLPPLAENPPSAETLPPDIEEPIPEEPAKKEESDPYLVLVNKEHPMEEKYNPANEDSVFEGLVPLTKNCGSQNVLVEKKAAKALDKMMRAMKKAGVNNVFVSSGWRSEEKQKSLFASYEKREAEGISERAKEYFGTEYLQAAYFSVGKTRLSKSDAEKVANYYSAFPGQSEHHTGLCVDFYTNGIKSQSDFANTKAFAWLTEHAQEYGWILRYPKGKEEITGYCFEPWHFRYVGEENAVKMKESGLSLEEYTK